MPGCPYSENISHDTIVAAPEYDNLPGVEYVDVNVGEGKTCRYAQSVKGVLPSILKDLLAQRKLARARIRDTDDEFKKAVLDGLQQAYKVMANSLYGQVGARTSPIYMRELAASTTAVGRNMILKAKKFIEVRGRK